MRNQGILLSLLLSACGSAPCPSGTLSGHGICVKDAGDIDVAEVDLALEIVARELSNRHSDVFGSAQDILATVEDALVSVRFVESLPSETHHGQTIGVSITLARVINGQRRDLGGTAITHELLHALSYIYDLPRGHDYADLFYPIAPTRVRGTIDTVTGYALCVELGQIDSCMYHQE